MAEQFWETVIFGAGPVGLVTALAAARSGSVLVMSPRVPQSARALRIDSVSLALMALFVELGLHPSEINAEETHDHRLAAWESKTPALIRSAATVYIERPLLEQSLMALARRPSGHNSPIRGFARSLAENKFAPRCDGAAGRQRRGEIGS